MTPAIDVIAAKIAVKTTLSVMLTPNHEVYFGILPF
jgi:hypothetical protein